MYFQVYFQVYFRLYFQSAQPSFCPKYSKKIVIDGTMLKANCIFILGPQANLPAWKCTNGTWVRLAASHEVKIFFNRDLDYSFIESVCCLLDTTARPWIESTAYRFDFWIQYMSIPI